MAKIYEINGSVFTDPKHILGECYTLTNTGEKDLKEQVRYDTLDDAMKVKRATSLDQFAAITIYEWIDDTISNVFFIK